MTTPKRGRWHRWLIGDTVIVKGEDPNESWKVVKITGSREFADIVALCGNRMGSYRFVRVSRLVMLHPVEEEADDNTSS